VCQLTVIEHFDELEDSRTNLIAGREHALLDQFELQRREEDLSVTALSQRLPLRDMLICIPCWSRH